MCRVTKDRIKNEYLKGNIGVVSNCYQNEGE